MTPRGRIYSPLRRRTAIRQKLHDGGPRLARKTMARLLAACCLTLAVAFAASAPARAEPVSAADARAAKAIVSGQLAAFASDDAKLAFSYAAPAIRSMFQTPERFLAMVRAGYPVVYRPAAVTFLLPLRVEGRLYQGVHLTDAAGALWLATYRLEHQRDGSWRIAACDVQPATGKMV